MKLHEFIFTNKRPERYLRHLAFWIAQSIFWVFWASFFFYRTWEWIYFGFLTHGFFILEIAYTYLVTYFLAPEYLDKKKYSKFALYVSLLTLITFFLFVAFQFIAKGVPESSRDDQLLYAWFSTMHFIIAGPPVICAMFLTVKMLKNYFIKMQEKATIVEESANAELQLLKAQIHPHFLFNTLNNIYSFNLDRSPLAAELVMKLSHTLKYMVNDCEAELVPLEKEIKMLQDYIGLEKVRYGQRLTMEVQITGDPANKLIAPLLLIPFVENSFKHGSSKMLEHPWIKMKISISENMLAFELSNSKPEHAADLNGKNGIGLTNVKKRLGLLYSNKHSLVISDNPTSFHVHLKLPLEEEEISEPHRNQEAEITEPAI